MPTCWLRHSTSRLLRSEPWRTSVKNAAVLGDQLVLAERLFRSGARPPVVSALCGLGKKTAIRIYREIHNASPKQGMLPYDPYWILRSSVNAVHASIFLGAFSDVSRAKGPGITDAPGLHDGL